MNRSRKHIIVGVVAAVLLSVAAFALLEDNTVADQINRMALHQSAGRQADHFPITPLQDSGRLRSLKVDALLGKPESAGELVNIFENCLSRHQTGTGAGLPSATDCEREMRFWVVVGSENGDLNMIGIRFNEYFSSASCIDNYRGKFWLKKILAKQSEEPWLTMNQEIDKKIRNCTW